jgi:hypothetical protein
MRKTEPSGCLVPSAALAIIALGLVIKAAVIGGMVAIGYYVFRWVTG